LDLLKAEAVAKHEEKDRKIRKELQVKAVNIQVEKTPNKYKELKEAIEKVALDLKLYQG